MARTSRFPAIARFGADVWWAVGLLALVAIGAVGLYRPSFVASGRLEACRSNLRNIATALEMYSTDYSGRVPLGNFAAYDPRYESAPAVGVLELSALVPKYLKRIPTCPSAGRDTYSLGCFNVIGSDAYFIVCRGHHHEEAGAAPDSPRYGSSQGLDDTAKVVCQESDRPAVSGRLDYGPLRLGMRVSDALRLTAGRREYDHPPCVAWMGGKAYADARGCLFSVSSHRLTVAGQTLREGDSTSRVAQVLGEPARRLRIPDTYGNTLRWEYEAESSWLDVDLDPDTQRVRFFVVWRDPSEEP